MEMRSVPFGNTRNCLARYASHASRASSLNAPVRQRVRLRGVSLREFPTNACIYASFRVYEANVGCPNARLPPASPGPLYRIRAPTDPPLPQGVGPQIRMPPSSVPHLHIKALIKGYKSLMALAHMFVIRR